MREGQLVNVCIQWLYLNGCFVWRNNTGGYKPEGSDRYIRYGTPGSPDIIGVTPAGRFIGVECKVGSNSLSDKQCQFQSKIEGKKGLYIVVREIDDLEDRKTEICQ